MSGLHFVEQQQQIMLVAKLPQPDQVFGRRDCDSTFALDRFNRLVADAAARPVYVFDDDGVRAGAVWYLHLRATDLADPDAARIRARSLGLADEGDEAKAFWVAINQLLANR